MLELLLYEYSIITDTQHETPSMQICIDGCFDPNDQDHYGQNFNLQIKGDGKLLYDIGLTKNISMIFTIYLRV